MKPLLITFSIALLSSIQLRSQWVQVPSGVTDSLTAITAIDGAFYVAGGNGTFLRSYDNGLSFNSTNGFDSTACFEWDQMGGFSHLSFFDELNGIGSTTYACRTQITEDGGVTWTSYLSNTGQPLNLGLALNDSDAVAFRWGPALDFSYPDGQLLQEPDADVYGDLDILCPAGPNVCLYYITGNSDTISVTAGSHTWSLTSDDRLATYSSGTITYCYYGTGISAEVIAGDTIVLLTNYGSFLTGPNLIISYDKGISWNAPVPYPFDPLEDIGMHWPNSNLGFASGPNGIIGHTLDGGQSWNMIPTPTSEHLNDIHFINDQQGWAVGENGTIISTIDGGNTWLLEESGVTADLLAIDSNEEAVIIIGHNGTILRRSLTTGISDQITSNTFSISVLDPMARTIRINSNSLIDNVDLFDATGRMVARSDRSGTLIDIVIASPGLYVARAAFSDGTIYSDRIVMP